MKLLAACYESPPRLGGVASMSDELLSALIRRGHEVRTVRVPEGRGALAATLPLAWEIRRAARKFAPDAALGFLWLPDLWALRWSGVKVPTFCFVHGVELLESRASFRKRARARLAPWKSNLLANASSVIAVSEYTAGLARALPGVRADRVRVVLNGVNPEKFTPGPPSERLRKAWGTEGRRVWLTLSRLDDYKGVDRALEAWARVRSRFPDWVYVIAGDGPDRERLDGMIRDLGIEDQTRRVGRLAPEDLVDAYRTSELFALLSREDLRTPNNEGFGLVFLEAAACGIPSLGGRSGGIPEAVLDGRTGWLANPESADDIAHRLSEALGDEAGRRRLGAAARARAVGELSWDSRAMELEGILCAE